MRALVVDDDETLRLTLRVILESQGYAVDEAPDGVSAVRKVEQLKNSQEVYKAAFLDVNMPNKNGIDALAEIKTLSPETLCLVLTAYSNVQDAVTAIKHGAYDYVEKPIEADRIISILGEAKEANELVETLAFSAPQLKFDEGRTIIGGSTPIQKVFDLIYKLSKVDTSVLIRGESGTGKELVARAVHFNSHRKKGPFVAVNCAAIPENLIESELFGHEKGAFTGADRKKIGKFQFAEGGTIFLDEIGDISSQMQVKLLRVLQEKRVTPVGSNSENHIDVRIVAATNRPLESMIEDNSFRADLFYRLNVLPINLPPLRERQDDIPPLINMLLKKFNRTHNRNMEGLEPEALLALKSHSWPGNIRELENVIEHAFIVESSETISAASLPEFILQGRKSAMNGNHRINGEGGHDFLIDNSSEMNFPELREKFEREFLIKALQKFNGRVNQTAENTRMTKVTLLRKLEKYGINPKEYIQPN